MSLNDREFLLRLANLADPNILCDILEISTEDLIEMFSDKIEQRIEDLREIFDVDVDEYMEYDE
jgi:hypothetical protein